MDSLGMPRKGPESELAAPAGVSNRCCVIFPAKPQFEFLPSGLHPATLREILRSLQRQNTCLSPPPRSHSLSAWAPISRSVHRRRLALACAFQLLLARLGSASAPCSSLKPFTSPSCSPHPCHSLLSVIAFWKKGGAREARVAPSPDMAPGLLAPAALLLPKPLDSSHRTFAKEVLVSPRFQPNWQTLGR